MIQASGNATLSLYPQRNARLRLFALWYFAVLMILWNIAGHTFLGFEQSWATPFAAVMAAVVTQLALEWLDAKTSGRPPRFSGNFTSFINYLPPAMITGFACAMLLYPNDRISPIIFASVLAIASKVLFRVRLADGRLTHFLNPSNFGIAATLLLLPDVGQAPPYQFTENITGWGHWILPAVILLSGIIVHRYATGRLPLIAAWLAAFVLQGVFRAWVAGVDWYVPLMPMSSAGFILFTLYMIPDPATTPILPKRQVAFGASVALVYALLQLLHIVFGLFLALITVCVIRGCAIYFFPNALVSKKRTVPPQVELALRPGATQTALSALSKAVGSPPVSHKSRELPGKELTTYRPRITFQDTNVVGNVYFLCYFRWQLEGFHQWLQSDHPELWATLGAGSAPWAISNWSTEFFDPVGATIGDEMDVQLEMDGSADRLTVASVIHRVIGEHSETIARGKMELVSVSDVAVQCNDYCTGPCYKYHPQWQLKSLEPIDLVSWQGKCRELFLLDHAPVTLNLVANRQLALQTTSAGLHLHGILSPPSSPVWVELRLKDIKCGQIWLQFDYFTSHQGQQTLLATGWQKTSCKRIDGTRVVPCAVPDDVLRALKRFTDSPELRTKIDQISEFSQPQKV